MKAARRPNSGDLRRRATTGFRRPSPPHDDRIPATFAMPLADRIPATFAMLHDERKSGWSA
jgi:hypothetical protein